MNEAIGQILSLGVVIALSPVPVIAIVLVLATPRARSCGPALLLGWVAGLCLVGAVVLLLSGAADADADDDSGPATWVSWLMIVLGVLLVLLAVKQWRGRPKAGDDASLPKWMRSIENLTPAKTIAMGALLSGMNPKHLLLTVAASAAIAETGIDAGRETIALAVFILIGSLGIGVPLVIFLVLGERSRKLLDGLKSWMSAHNVAIMAGITLVIGTKLLGDGIAAL
jgi:threonine/homoserine/homoserine lactone efflux protein